METLLERDCNEVLYARSLKDSLGKMVALSADCGFGRVSATVMTEHSPSLTEYQFIANTPSEYVPEFEAPDAAHIDQFSQHARYSSAPSVNWSSLKTPALFKRHHINRE